MMPGKLRKGNGFCFYLPVFNLAFEESLFICPLLGCMVDLSISLSVWLSLIVGLPVSLWLMFLLVLHVQGKFGFYRSLVLVE